MVDDKWLSHMHSLPIYTKKKLYAAISFPWKPEPQALIFVNNILAPLLCCIGSCCCSSWEAPWSYFRPPQLRLTLVFPACWGLGEERLRR